MLNTIVQQLKAERTEAQKRIYQIDQALHALNGNKVVRRISAAGLKRIAEAQRKRWAKARRAK